MIYDKLYKKVRFKKISGLLYKKKHSINRFDDNDSKHVLINR